MSLGHSPRRPWNLAFIALASCSVLLLTGLDCMPTQPTENQNTTNDDTGIPLVIPPPPEVEKDYISKVITGEAGSVLAMISLEPLGQRRYAPDYFVTESMAVEWVSSADPAKPDQYIDMWTEDGSFVSVFTGLNGAVVSQVITVIRAYVPSIDTGRLFEFVLDADSQLQAAQAYLVVEPATAAALGWGVVKSPAYVYYTRPKSEAAIPSRGKLRLSDSLAALEKAGTATMSLSNGGEPESEGEAAARLIQDKIKVANKDMLGRLIGQVGDLLGELADKVGLPQVQENVVTAVSNILTRFGEFIEGQQINDPTGIDVATRRQLRSDWPDTFSSTSRPPRSSFTAAEPPPSFNAVAAKLKGPESATQLRVARIVPVRVKLQTSIFETTIEVPKFPATISFQATIEKPAGMAVTPTWRSGFGLKWFPTTDHYRQVNETTYEADVEAPTEGRYSVFFTAADAANPSHAPQRMLEFTVKEVVELTTGACCSTNGGCTVTTAAQCTGTFKGVGTSCATGSCNSTPSPPPPLPRNCGPEYDTELAVLSAESARRGADWHRSISSGDYCVQHRIEIEYHNWALSLNSSGWELGHDPGSGISQCFCYAPLVPPDPEGDARAARDCMERQRAMHEHSIMASEQLLTNCR